MRLSPAPYGFANIEEWILFQLFDQSKAAHTTATLFQQLDVVLKSGPSQRDLVNQLRGALGQSALSDEDPVEEKTLEFSDVEDAVESLIESGVATGDIDSGESGVYFTGLKLTRKGYAPAIRAKRKRAEDANALRSLSASHTNFESIVREIRARDSE